MKLTEQMIYVILNGIATAESEGYIAAPDQGYFPELEKTEQELIREIYKVFPKIVVEYKNHISYIRTLIKE